MDLKGSRSIKNIAAAFEGESKARNKYTYYALQARKAGNEEIAAFFERMADNEKEHAKIWFKFLNDGLGDIETNLKEAAGGENYECTKMYPEFAKVAREEGYDMLAMMFEKVSAIERDHERQFIEKLIQFMNESRGVKQSEKAEAAPKPKQVKFRCAICGNIEDTMLDVCPVCEAIGYFEKVLIEG